MTADITLDAGERILWTGEPQRHPLFERADLVLVPLSLAGLGLLVFFEFTVLRDGPRFPAIWGGVILVLGALQLVGRPLLRVLRLRSTTYTVTDRRVVEVSRLPFRRRVEETLRYLGPPVVRDQARHGTGSIAFGEFPSFVDEFRRTGFFTRWNKRPPRPFVLWHISQAEHVRGVIAQVQR